MWGLHEQIRTLIVNWGNKKLVNWVWGIDFWDPYFLDGSTLRKLPYMKVVYMLTKSKKTYIPRVNGQLALSRAFGDFQLKVA